MTIRKIQSPYNYITKTIIIAIAAMILIGQTIHKGNKQISITQESSAIYAPNGIQIYSTIQATGNIIKDSNFPIHTHLLILDNQARIGLRSSTINLNNFLGNYEIAGTIHNINKGVPSIDVDRIRNPKQKIFIQNNIYTYFSEQIIINLKTLPTIYSKIIDGVITIISDETPIITIQYMACNQNPNCSIYQDTINNNDIERFTSTIGHTFYKKQEGQWILKHDNGDLYIVQGDNDDIIDFSSTIELLDAAYIIREYKEQIFNACNELENIRTANVTQKGDITILQVEGNNIKTEIVGCTISFDLWNNIGITNVSLF